MTDNKDTSPDGTEGWIDEETRYSVTTVAPAEPFDALGANAATEDGATPLNVGAVYLQSGGSFSIEVVTWLMSHAIEAEDIGILAQLSGVPQDIVLSVTFELPKLQRELLVGSYLRARVSVHSVPSVPPQRTEIMSLPQGGELPSAFVVGGYSVVVDAHGLTLRGRDKDPKPISNFVAVVSEYRLRDDGFDAVAEYGIDVYHAGGWRRLYVDAKDFADLGWLSTQVGPTAIYFPRCREDVRAAIQALSFHVHKGPVPRTVVYGHLGWRQLPDGQRVFLTAAGALGENGIVPGVEVALRGDFSRYALEAVKVDDDLRTAVRASLSIMDIGPDVITVPLLCGTYRPVLGDASGSLFFVAYTGSLKSSLVALAQQHFGSEMDALNLPAAWSSTANALEMMASVAKDCLLVIDDFNPQGSPNEVSAWHAKADRVLRAAANSSGRSRLGKDSELQETRPARCFVMSTGEDVAKGQSLRGRAPAVEMLRGDIDLNKLTVVQKAAESGVLARAMSGYVQWVARNWDGVQSERKRLAGQLRYELQEVPGHPFTRTIIAELASGFRCFMDYALDTDSVSEPEAHELWRRAWEAMREVLRRQGEGQRDAHPVDKFFLHLRSSISSGHAHVANFDGEVPSPQSAGAWGWRRRVANQPWSELIEPPDDTWLPQGECVGHVRGDDLYLDPSAAYGAAQSQARRTGDSLPLNELTLGKRLKERGLLMVEPSRDTNKSRVTISGQLRQMWHLNVSVMGVGLWERNPDPLDEHWTAPVPRDADRDEVHVTPEKPLTEPVLALPRGPHDAVVGSDPTDGRLHEVEPDHHSTGATWEHELDGHIGQLIEDTKKAW